MSSAPPQPHFSRAPLTNGTQITSPITWFLSPCFISEPNRSQIHFIFAYHKMRLFTTRRDLLTLRLASISSATSYLLPASFASNGLTRAVFSPTESQASFLGSIQYAATNEKFQDDVWLHHSCGPCVLMLRSYLTLAKCFSGRSTIYIFVFCLFLCYHLLLTNFHISQTLPQFVQHAAYTVMMHFGSSFPVTGSILTEYILRCKPTIRL